MSSNTVVLQYSYCELLYLLLKKKKYVISDVTFWLYIIERQLITMSLKLAQLSIFNAINSMLIIQPWSFHAGINATFYMVRAGN